MEPDNQNERVTGWLTAVKGLTYTNAVVIGMLAVIAVPVYVVYRAMNDPDVMDRMLSSYRELPSESGCSLRELKLRVSSRQWSISTGFAYQGNDRWIAAVILDHQPNGEEIESFCASLKLITGAWEGAP